MPTMSSPIRYLYEPDKTGFMSFTKCPDCRFKLVPIKKILRFDGVSGVMAKVCPNPNCWRYTDHMQLATWVKSL